MWLLVILKGWWSDGEYKLWYINGKYLYQIDLNNLDLGVDEEFVKQKEDIMARGKGNCGGTRRRDGSGKGVGNKGTPRQPKK